MTSVQHPLATQERLERLVVTTSALIAETSLEAVLDRVVQVAAEIIGARYAAIGVLAPDGRLLESFVTHGIDAEHSGPDRPAAARARHPRPGHPRGPADPAARPGTSIRTPTASLRTIPRCTRSLACRSWAGGARSAICI